jgi:hypothetical protein
VTLGNYVAAYNNAQETVALIGDFRSSAVGTGDNNDRAKKLERAGWIVSDDDKNNYGLNRTASNALAANADKIPDIGYNSLLDNQGYLSFDSSWIYSGKYGGQGDDSYFDRSNWAAGFNINPSWEKGDYGGNAVPAVGTTDRAVIDILQNLGLKGNPRGVSGYNEYHGFRPANNGGNFTMNFVCK